LIHDTVSGLTVTVLFSLVWFKLSVITCSVLNVSPHFHARLFS